MTSMITRTSEIAVRALLYIAPHRDRHPIAVQEIAARIGTSPAYTAKIVGQLVKAGILSSQRGVNGGVTLIRSPREITILHIVQACQDLITEVYCQNEKGEACQACGYHRAMQELHESITGVLSGWTLEKLMDRAIGRMGQKVNRECKMYMVENLTPPDESVSSHA